jgi:hypothetical protein
VRLVVPVRAFCGGHQPHARSTIAAPVSPFVDRRYRLVLPHRFWGSTMVRFKDPHKQPDQSRSRQARCYLPGAAPTRGTPAVLAGLTCERMDDSLRAAQAKPIARATRAGI